MRPHGFMFALVLVAPFWAAVAAIAWWVSR